jgi:hypothetical protein
MDESHPCSGCPEEVANAVIEILYMAILSIRASTWSIKSTDYCGVEADHIHNLPDLLREYKRGKLEYYLDVERSIYLKQSAIIPANHQGIFDRPWKQLEQFLERERGK